MTRFETMLPPAQQHALGFLVEPQKDGLVTIENNKITVTEKGRPFIRNICMAFDARLQRHQPNTEIFSRTI